MPNYFGTRRTTLLAPTAVIAAAGGAELLLNDSASAVLLNATGSVLLNTSSLKINSLTDRVTITGTEEAVINRSATDRKATMTELKTFINA